MKLWKPHHKKTDVAQTVQGNSVGGGVLILHRITASSSNRGQQSLLE